MNEDLPPVTPRKAPNSRPTKADLIGFLRGLQPGWYTTADLQPRYEAWAVREGKTVRSRKALGEAISIHLRPERAGAHNHVSVWMITEEVINGESSPPLTGEGQADGGAQMSSGTVS